MEPISDPTLTEQAVPSLFDQAARMEDDGAPPLELKIDPSAFGIDLTDHNPEANAIRGADEQDGVATLQELPHPHTRLNNPALIADPVGKMKNEIDPFSDNFTLGKVEVTLEERDAFVRAALHDEELVFNVYLEGIDATVAVAIPTESFTTMVANTIEMWDDKGVTRAKNNVSWLLLFQQIHAWYQVREFNGKPTKWSAAFDDGVPKISALRKILSDIENFEDVINMSAPRWRMMVNAMAIAEYKYKLCMDAWRTRSFFAKADTD